MKRITVKKAFSSAMLAIALALGLALTACDNGTTIEERQPVTYSGTTGNATYTLTISPASGRAAHLEGDDYVLIVERGGSEKTGVGKVKDVNDNVFVLQPSVENAPPFNVATSDTSIVNISGTITRATAFTFFLQQKRRRTDKYRFLKTGR